MIVKNRLKRFTSDYHALKEDTNYELEIERSWFGGLFTTTKRITVTLTRFDNHSKYFKLWQELIKTRKPIRI